MPPDPAIEEELEAFVARRKAEIGNRKARRSPPQSLKSLPCLPASGVTPEILPMTLSGQA